METIIIIPLTVAYHNSRCAFLVSTIGFQLIGNLDEFPFVQLIQKNICNSSRFLLEWERSHTYKRSKRIETATDNHRRS